MTQISTKTATLTESKSLTMMRNLIRTSISSIAYMRNFFPDSCFTDRIFSTINVKMLKNASPESQLLIKWLEYGVFDALEKKYLRMLIFGIYTDPNHPNTLLEAYTFSVTYTSTDNIQINISNSKTSQEIALTEENCRKEIVTLIRKLVSMTSTLCALPDERYITMKLLYYDERTPKEYEPSFFKSCSDDPLNFTEKPVKVTIGTLNTPFHGLTFKVKSTNESNEETGKKPGNLERIKKMRWCVEESESEEEKDKEESIAQKEKENPPSIKKGNNNLPEKNKETENPILTKKGNNNRPEKEKESTKFKEKESLREKNINPSKKTPEKVTKIIVDTESSATEDEYGPSAPHVIDQSGYHSQSETDIDEISESLWNLAIGMANKYKYLTAYQLQKQLAIKEDVAIKLTQRMEKEGWLSPREGRKLRQKVLKKSTDGEESVSSITSERNVSFSFNSKSKPDRPKENEEAISSMTEDDPSPKKMGKKRRFSSIELEESQDTLLMKEKNSKTSIIEKPISQARRKLFHQQ